MHFTKPHTQREHDCEVLCSLSGTVTRRILSPCLTFQFLLRKLLSDCQANIRVFFDLAPRPYTELQNHGRQSQRQLLQVTWAGKKFSASNVTNIGFTGALRNSPQSAWHLSAISFCCRYIDTTERLETFSVFLFRFFNHSVHNEFPE